MTARTTPSGLHYMVVPSTPLSFEMRKALWETALYLATEALRSAEAEARLLDMTPGQYNDWLLAQDEEYQARYDAQRRSA